MDSNKPVAPIPPPTHIVTIPYLQFLRLRYLAKFPNFLDHVIPKSKKGPSNWEKVVTACKSCNLKKGDKPGKPIKEPIKPSFSHLLNGHKFEKDAFPDKDWAKYIFSS